MIRRVSNVRTTDWGEGYINRDPTYFVTRRAGEDSPGAAFNAIVLITSAKWFPGGSERTGSRFNNIV